MFVLRGGLANQLSDANGYLQGIYLRNNWSHSAAERLVHGRARVGHCVTGRWRNFSHYYRPLRQYDVWYVFWAQRSTARCADSTRCTQTRVYSAMGKYVVRHWTSREASLRHSSGWGTWNVSPQYRDLRTRGLVTSLTPSMTRSHRDNTRKWPERGYFRFPAIHFANCTVVWHFVR